LRALVAGSGGQLGRELVAALGGEVAWAGDRTALDVTDGAAVVAVVSAARPDVVLNAAAYNKVDRAEVEPELALEVNALAPRRLALAARECGAVFVHFSTDYVFDGTSTRPYREDDRTGPLGVYGASKLAGEHLARVVDGAHLIIRTSGVLGRGGSGQKGGSFAARILEKARRGEPLRVVDDQTFAPTCAADLAAAALILVRAGARGVVHVTNSGTCTWYELARAALAHAGIEAEVEAIRSVDLGLPARRPAYSVLDTGRSRDLGLPPLRPWQEALSDCVAAVAS